jgi:hypothetical protein
VPLNGALKPKYLPVCFASVTPSACAIISSDFPLDELIEELCDQLADVPIQPEPSNDYSRDKPRLQSQLVIP